MSRSYLFCDECGSDEGLTCRGGLAWHQGEGKWIDADDRDDRDDFYCNECCSESIDPIEVWADSLEDAKIKAQNALNSLQEDRINDSIEECIDQSILGKNADGFEFVYFSEDLLLTREQLIKKYPDTENSNPGCGCAWCQHVRAEDIEEAEVEEEDDEEDLSEYEKAVNLGCEICNEKIGWNTEDDDEGSYEVAYKDDMKLSDEELEAKYPETDNACEGCGCSVCCTIRAEELPGWTRTPAKTQTADNKSTTTRIDLSAPAYQPFTVSDLSEIKPVDLDEIMPKPVF